MLLPRRGITCSVCLVVSMGPEESDSDSRRDESWLWPPSSRHLRRFFEEPSLSDSSCASVSWFDVSLLTRHRVARCVGVVDDAGRAFACSTLVVGGEFFSLSPGATSASNSSENSSENEEQRLRQRPPSPTTATPTTTTAPPPTPPPSTPQSQPLTPPPPLSSTTRLLPPETRPLATPSRLRSRLLRRVVIASGPVAPEGRGRGLCVLPPGLESVGNPAAVHVVSLDESTAACPGNLDGACVIHLTTTTTTASAASAANGEASTPGDSEGGQALSVGDAAQVDCSRKEIEAAAGTGAAAVGGVEAGLDRGPGGVSEDENGREGVLGRAARELLAAAGVEEVGCNSGCGWF